MTEPKLSERGAFTAEAAFVQTEAALLVLVDALLDLVDGLIATPPANHSEKNTAILDAHTLRCRYRALGGR